MDDVPASFRQKLQRLRWKPEMILKNYRTATSGAARSGAQTPGFTSRVTDRDSRSHWGIEVRTKRDTRVACHPRFPRPTAWFGQSGDFLNSRACWISSRNLWREVEPENQWDELSFSGNSMPLRKHESLPAAHQVGTSTKAPATDPQPQLGSWKHKTSGFTSGGARSHWGTKPMGRIEF